MHPGPGRGARIRAPGYGYRPVAVGSTGFAERVDHAAADMILERIQG